jgi:hypothetical protein
MNKSIFCFFLVIILISSCSNPNPYDCKIDQSILSKNDSVRNDKWEKKSYYAFLKRSHEQELKTFANKVYRLSVSYSFERDLWIYRVRQTEDGGILTIKKTYHKAYKDYCRVHDTIISKKISLKQWKSIDKAVNSNCLWTLQYFDGRHGLDGASYIMEAFDPEAENPVGKNYTTVVRWSPEKGTGFRAICDAIQELDDETDEE